MNGRLQGSERYRLIHGDSVAELRHFSDNLFDSVICDPPYGLGEAPDALAMLTDWIMSGRHEMKGNGFMHKAWDAFVPQPALWKQVFRVLKPGAYLLAFGGARTYDLTVLGLRIAGFEIKDQLNWVYGSGMNKVGYIRGKNGRAIIPGFGGSLKPAHEPIVLARKPFKGTLRNNLITHGTGALNIDGCRVELSKDDPLHAGVKHKPHALDTKGQGWGFVALDRTPGLARWPANLIHDGSDEVLQQFPGTAARFFQLCPWSEQDAGPNSFVYCPKASDRDRNEGLPEGIRNRHLTVKPNELMRYLVRLVTPVGGIVLDPFCGSGSTAKAAVLEGFRFYGIELTAEYIPIAKARIEHALKEAPIPRRR